MHFAQISPSSLGHILRRNYSTEAGPGWLGRLLSLHSFDIQRLDSTHLDRRAICLDQLAYFGTTTYWPCGVGAVRDLRDVPCQGAVFAENYFSRRECQISLCSDILPWYDCESFSAVKLLYQGLTCRDCQYWPLSWGFDSRLGHHNNKPISTQCLQSTKSQDFFNSKFACG